MMNWPPHFAALRIGDQVFPIASWMAHAGNRFAIPLGGKRPSRATARNRILAANFAIGDEGPITPRRLIARL